MGSMLCCAECCPPKAVVHEEQQNAVTKEASQGEEVKTSASDRISDTKFGDYINRAKLKIRTVSNIGGGKHASGQHNINEKVTNYINRAKLKMRTPSHVGGGKQVPIK